MHGQELGVQVNMLKETVKEVNLLENKMKITSGVLKRRLFARLLRLCDCAAVQHMTLLTLGNQKILKGWSVLNTEIRTKKKTRFFTPI